MDTVLELRALGYKWTKIAEVLEVSRATLYRHLEKAGVSTDRTPLTDQELDEVVVTIKNDHPNDGEKLMQGHLLRLGINVSRQSLRNSLHRVDHENIVARGRRTVKCRIYSVPYPNYVWHMDSHHKIIKWRFVIHGCIDGFSRTIIYLSCKDNNRASTVLTLFQNSVSEFGYVPEHVRSDHGGENVDVWRYVTSCNNGDPDSVITGSSVHNDRVERLWRDVNRCVASCYAETFRNLEESNRLDPLNEVDIFCLHLIFIPRINKRLNEFKESWNNHGISTEGNKTPYQLYIEGLGLIQSSRNSGTSQTQSQSQADSSPVVDAPDRVVVPRLRFMLCTSLYQSLTAINPLQSCNDNGTSFYATAIQVAGQHLSQQCTDCNIIGR